VAVAMVRGRWSGFMVGLGSSGLFAGPRAGAESAAAGMAEAAKTPGRKSWSFGSVVSDSCLRLELRKNQGRSGSLAYRALVSSR